MPELALHTPSGHTASAAVVYSGFLGSALPRGGFLLVRIAVALALALLFGTARVELDAHSAPETLVGGAVGLAGALMLVRLAGDRSRSSRFRRTGVIIVLMRKAPRRNPQPIGRQLRFGRFLIVVDDVVQRLGVRAKVEMLLLHHP